jgi:hypothetical protein
MWYLLFHVLTTVGHLKAKNNYKNAHKRYIAMKTNLEDIN